MTPSPAKPQDLARNALPAPSGDGLLVIRRTFVETLALRRFFVQPCMNCGEQAFVSGAVWRQIEHFHSVGHSFYFYCPICWRDYDNKDFAAMERRSWRHRAP